MLILSTATDEQTGEEVLMVPLAGTSLLENPMFNKGSAFSAEERDDFGLHGLLPPHIGSIEEQLERRYGDFHQCQTALKKHVYLRDLQDRNEVLFYRMAREHIAELMPVLYTPTVGEACQQFNRVYRRPRGLFLPYELRDRLDELFEHRMFRDVDVIVVTDGERILGLGDLGIGGMGIPVGKLSLYTLCGGIHPARTLPVFLDVGTDNQDALADPLYLGARHARIRGQAYDDFVDAFVAAVQRALPRVLLQFEDFAKNNARRLLDRYRDQLCTFNDDIQGTAAVTLAAVLAACQVTGTRIRDQRIVLLGSGSAGVGIADILLMAMKADGLSESQALERLWLLGSKGLLHDAMKDLQPAQLKYAKSMEGVSGLPSSPPWTPQQVVEHLRPTVLIGTTGQPGMFTESLVRSLARHVERPAILPLSNPTSRCEALPSDLIAWTEGRALVATGSPFEPVIFGGRTYRIAQCNNAYIFPGLGQGVISSGASRVTDSLFLAAARSLASLSNSRTAPGAPLLPPLEDIVSVSRSVALAVASQAASEGLCHPQSPEALALQIDSRWWSPQYPRMRRGR